MFGGIFCIKKAQDTHVLGKPESHFLHQGGKQDFGSGLGERSELHLRTTGRGGTFI